MPVSQQDLLSLQRQLQSARENLRLIEERKSEFVLGTDVPIQLIKEERRLRDRIAELEAKLGQSGQAPALPVSAETLTPQSYQPSELAADLIDQTGMTDAQPRSALVADLEPEMPAPQEEVSSAAGASISATKSSVVQQLAETPSQEASAGSPKVNEISLTEDLRENKVAATAAPPSVIQSDGSDSGRLPPVKPEQRQALILLCLAGLLGTAVLLLLFFDRLRCLVDYRISDGVVALLALLAGGVAVVISLLVSQTWRHRLWSLYGGSAAALLIGILVAWFLPPLSRELCWPVPTTTPAAQTAPLLTPVADEGSQQTREANGVTQIYVPGGTFSMGSAPFEAPVHPVTLDAFWIDRTEVTNAAFKQFVSDTRYRTDAEKSGVGWVYDPVSKESRATPGADWQHPHGTGSDLHDRDNHPVVQVSWHDAWAYCQWAGGQLPTEAQWEFAARSSHAYLFPWGNEQPDDTRANYGLNVGDTVPVGSYPQGKCWVEALDLAGNVTEWVSDWYAPYSDAALTNPTGPAGGTDRVWRGGSWYFNADFMRSAYRGHYSPDSHDNNLGFRCVSNAIAAAP